MSTIDEEDLIAGVTLRGRVLVGVSVAGIVLFVVLFNLQRGDGQGGGPVVVPGKAAAARAARGPARADARTGETFAWLMVGLSAAVLLPLSVFLPRSYVTRNRGQIAAGTWTPPLPREDSDALFRPAALRSDGGKLAYVYLIQFVFGVGLNQLLAFFAAVAYLITQQPIALGAFALFTCGVAARFPTRTGIATWIDRQQVAISDERQTTGSKASDTRTGKEPARPTRRPSTLDGSSRVENEAYRSVTEGRDANDLDRQQPPPNEDRRTAGSWFGAMTDDEATGPQVRPIDQQAGAGPPVLPGLFFLAGCGSLAMLVFGVILPEWSVNNRYVPNSCVVLDKRITSNQAATGRTDYPQIKIWYEVNGRKHEVWAYESVITLRQRPAAQKIVDRFQVGAIYPCWYDPDRPEKAVLIRGYSWSGYVLLVVPIVFLLLGGTGLYGFRKNQTKPARRKQSA